MPDIIVSDDGAIRTIRMNRPEKKNALTLAMYDVMAEAIEGAAARDDLACLLVAGHESGFCAGNDIADFVAMTKTGALGAPILRFLHALNRSEKPLVAAAAGRAVGVGTTMLLHCDHVVAAEDALFSTPFVALGLVPEAGSSLIASRLMGHSRAFELLVMGRPLTAAAAQTAGLVNTVVPAADLESTALAAARSIAALPPHAVAASRRLMRGQTAQIDGHIDAEAEAFRKRLASPEAKAAFTAFLERKK
jgi:enoyl-CoA hydratase/carnithine racemase